MIGGRVTKLHNALDEINCNLKDKKITVQLAKEFHEKACLESMAESMAIIADYITSERRHNGKGS